jgi:hypothetical protein
MRDSIQILRLDDYLAQHPIDRLDLIKCDTDGWEMDIFEGALATLRRFHPALVFELDPFGLAENGHSASALIRLLRDAGYQFYRTTDLRLYEGMERAVARVTTNHKLDVLALHSDASSSVR